MTARRVIAAVVSTVALLAFNVGTAETASAKGTHWGVDSPQKVQRAGTHWG